MQDHKIVLHCAGKDEHDGNWDAHLWYGIWKQLSHGTNLRKKYIHTVFIFIKTLCTIAALLWWKLRWRLRIIFHICIETERGLTKQLRSGGRQLVPVTHTRILCSSQWTGVFLWWAFYNSCFRSLHHLVRITPLTQKPHARTNSSVILTFKTSFTEFPSTTKALKVFQFLVFFGFLYSKLVYVLSWECFWLRILSATFLWPAHTKGQTYTKGRFNIRHMFSMSLVWHLQEHGDLCDWESRLWLWSRFMTYCSEMSTDYIARRCTTIVCMSASVYLVLETFHYLLVSS